MKHSSPNLHKAAARGWNNSGRYVAVYPGSLNPPRQGCRWNPKECFDLLNKYTAGVPVDVLARQHQRSQSAIDQQLPRALSGVEAYFQAADETRA